MNCREVEELIPAYLLGALDEKEQAQVEAHIRECPACLALFHEQSPAITLLSRVGDSLQAPPDLKQRVLGMVDTSSKPSMQLDTANGILGFLRSSLRRPVAATVMALATISLVGLSLSSLLLWLEVGDLKEEDSQTSAALQEQLEQFAIERKEGVLNVNRISEMLEVDTLAVKANRSAGFRRNREAIEKARAQKSQA